MNAILKRLVYDGYGVKRIEDTKAQKGDNL